MTEYITKEQAIDEVWDAFMSRDDPDLGRVIEENIKRLPETASSRRRCGSRSVRRLQA